MALDTNDYSQNSNNLTNNNGVTEYTASLPFAASSTAAAFARASNQSLSIADASQTGLDFSSPWDFTFEMWVNFATFTSGEWRTFLSKGTTASGGAYMWRIYNDSGTGRVRMDVADDAVNFSRLKWDWTPSVNTWYHLAVSWDASASESGFKFYVNASDQGAGTIENDDNVTTLYNSSDPFSVGTLGAGSQLMDGRIDEIRIWNDIRTGTEITNNYQIELSDPQNETNLVAYYPFEQVGLVTAQSYSFFM